MFSGVLFSGWVWSERLLSPFLGPFRSPRAEQGCELLRGRGGGGGCVTVSHGGAMAFLFPRPGAVTSVHTRLLHQTPVADRADR